MERSWQWPGVVATAGNRISLTVPMRRRVSAVESALPSSPSGGTLWRGMWRTFLVAVGGSIGAVARYWLAGAVQRLNGTDFPVGTLAVNLLGSFAVGMVLALSLERGLINADLRILLAVGVCGGFTTMSAFSYETLALLHDGDAARALGNVGLTVLGSVAAVWMGMITARVL